ncbi:hypothetical protein M427DRAFT_383259 [Gonapodya prolifera JEL478]|uniref:F-box domain-containing protein n=1 Tax=Gonapodya prolifera (strain JEL478) TaxID=1344416 RepID=A0A139A8Z3_GONPJ|nr:hypothetical protein M427DRAFT_383259 [Gonapodya prolifera JEL478]|eukprot:KXS13149.1 hypothetical protein M427DRAFT_383259 [Gonapodya prolifera JEL478]
MPALPPEILLRILAHVTTTKEFYNRIPLVCRQFAQLQEAVRHASTAIVTVSIQFPTSDWNGVISVIELEAMVDKSVTPESQIPWISSARKKILPYMRLHWSTPVTWNQTGSRLH